MAGEVASHIQHTPGLKTRRAGDANKRKEEKRGCVVGSWNSVTSHENTDPGSDPGHSDPGALTVC